MFPATTKHLLRSPRAQTLHSPTAQAGCLQIIFSYKIVFLQLQIRPLNIKHIVFCTYVLLTTEMSSATMQNVAMQTLWEVCNNNVTVYVTAYVQILGASPFFS